MSCPRALWLVDRRRWGSNQWWVDDSCLSRPWTLIILESCRRENEYYTFSTGCKHTHWHLHDFNNNHKPLKKNLSCDSGSFVQIHHVISKSSDHHCLNQNQNHVMDMWSGPRGECMAVIWDFPHVQLMWLFCKHTKRTDRQPLIIMVGDTSSCFLWQVPSSLVVRHHIYAVSLTSTLRIFFSRPQTSNMWPELLETIKEFFFFHSETLGCNKNGWGTSLSGSTGSKYLDRCGQLCPSVPPVHFKIIESFFFVLISFQVKQLTRTTSSESVVNSGKGLGKDDQGWWEIHQHTHPTHTREFQIVMNFIALATQ